MEKCKECGLEFDEGAMVGGYCASCGEDVETGQPKADLEKAVAALEDYSRQRWYISSGRAERDWEKYRGNK